MTDTSTTTAPAAHDSGYYQRHIFFCLNDRTNGEDSCAHHGAQAAFDRCKSQVKAAGLSGAGKVRVNKAGCLDRCAGGPIAVVYPEGSLVHLRGQRTTSTRSSNRTSRMARWWSVCVTPRGTRPLNSHSERCCPWPDSRLPALPLHAQSCY